ncbi:hypothetical protein Dip510_001341 [Elusimicrobium posterum]|uniref:imm11 family protein n=1 Tax=Elusimicrobium posterum TaxID=3116653 RepID=UPI003C78F9B7
MNYNNIDKEYYVMNFDGANNHPLLSWAKTDFTPFLAGALISENTLTLPLEIVFSEPYPKEYQMPDLLMLDSCFAGSQKLKDLFEKSNISGVQFFPANITTNKKEVITGYYAINFANKLTAIDKNNYDGGPVNRFGNILRLNKFSLDENLLKNIPMQERKAFILKEKANILLVHSDIANAIKEGDFDGITLIPVTEWNANSFFA